MLYDNLLHESGLGCHNQQGTDESNGYKQLQGNYASFM